MMMSKPSIDIAVLQLDQWGTGDLCQSVPGGPPDNSCASPTVRPVEGADIRPGHRGTEPSVESKTND